MNALGIAAGVCAVIFVVILLCALSYWIGRRAQAAATLDALEEALRSLDDADELASDHWGVP